MPCDTFLRPRQTLAEREREVDAALRRLQAQLEQGQVQVQIGQAGSIAFSNWNDRDGLSDVCAFRLLQLKNSWPLRQAVARAEQMSGRKVNERAVIAGVHSHDGGSTWHKGH